MPSRPLAGLAVSARRRHVRPDRGRAAAFDREVGDRDRAGLARDRPRLPGRRSSDRCGSRRDLRRGRRGSDVPMVRAQRPVPRDLPAGQGRPPRRERPSRRGDRVGHQGPARAGRAGREAGGPGGHREAPRRSGSGSDATERRTGAYVFAKLYAKSHVRADRWYKLGRTILYGALEDEKPFQSVRRFVEYEDYTLRLLSELGVPRPAALRDRRDHPRARVHDRDGVLRGRRRDRRRGHRRRRDRPGARAGSEDCGTRGSRTATSSRRT